MMEELTDMDLYSGLRPFIRSVDDQMVKREVVVEESSDDEEEDKEVTYHADCHVIENSLNNFFNDEVDSDSDSSQFAQNSAATGGGTGGLDRGPIHPDCLPAANENFNIFQRTSPLTSLTSIEDPIKQFIATCITSKEDPKCSQEFYALIHRQLYIAMRHNLISSPEELDEYWLKFDNWATYAYQKKVIANPDQRQIYLRQIQMANNASVKPPNPTENQEKQTPQHFYRISCTDSYKNKIIERMETIIHKLILAVPRSLDEGPHALAVRNDVRSRVKFYLKWRSYNYQSYKTFLDFYWNIFLNRKSDYYRSHPVPKSFSVKVPQGKKVRNFQSVRNEVLRRKKFRRERIIKNCVNECIDLEIDPRASHKFHWTIHRCLQAVYGEYPENRISLNEMLRIWKKFDEMAVKAFVDKEKFTVSPPRGNGEYYEEASELPPLTSSSRQLVTLQKLKGSKLNEMMIRHLKEFVIKYGYGEDGEISPILGNVEIRREFLMRYVNQLEVEGNLEEGENKQNLNYYWRELVTRTCSMYKGWRRMKEEEKEKADLLIDKSLRGRVRKG